MALFIGLISGTSMDAVDAALVAFGDGKATTVATHSAPIPDGMKRELLALSQESFRRRGSASGARTYGSDRCSRTPRSTS